MKMLSYLCIIASVIVLIAGVVSKYVAPIGDLQPASFLLAMQALLLLSANLLLLAILKK